MAHNFTFEFDDKELTRALDRLVREFPKAAERTIDKVKVIIASEIRKKAPYRNYDDGARDKNWEQHLKDTVNATATKYSVKHGGYYAYIKFQPRGKHDKNIHKAIGTEYGTSRQPAKPWFRPTIQASQKKMLQIAMAEYTQAKTKAGF